MLASQEVATLITALGCGIGPDEYDPDKVRYHRIIIMTDADVDGSHIRTLLLTFFYRQAPELIHRGYIYIAQPPLYKIKQGKQEQYVKDDDALHAYLVHNALDGAAFHPSKEAPAITDIALAEHVAQFKQMEKILHKHAQRYPLTLLKALAAIPSLTPSMFYAQDQMQLWIIELNNVLNQLASSTQLFTVELILTAENNAQWLPKIILTQHGIQQSFILSPEFFLLKDYQEIVAINARLNQLIDEGAFVKRGDHINMVHCFEDALTWLLDEAKRGQNIQRYKGLGEMNPDQLWETTMDPDVRHMLRVTIDDAAAADEIFTTLMGDQVEPRRDFIETNALYAEIDI